MSLTTPSVAASEWDYIEETHDIVSEDIAAYGLVQDGDGNWWLLGGDTDNVYKYDSDWTYLGETHDVSRNFGENVTEDIYLDENGDWWITASQYVYKYDSNWNYIENHSVTADPYFVAAAQDENGDWWLLGTSGDNVYKYYDNWDYTGETHDISSEETSPEALWRDTYGNWWMTGLASDEAHKYDSSWGFISSYSITIQTIPPTISVTGIAQDSDGNWWVSDIWNDNVFKFQGAPEMTTSSATDVAGTTATLNGTLDSLGSFQSANLLFQFRKQGDSTWRETPRTSGVTSPTSFSREISSLSGFTIYEFRTVAEYNPTVYGDTLTFTTERAQSYPPPPLPEEEEEVPDEEVIPPLPPDEAPPVTFTPTAPPRVWYAQVMEAQNRPSDAPFPTMEPPFFAPFMAATEAEKGPGMISSAFAMALLFVVMLFTIPRGRWGETPENWGEGSGPGSWTHITTAAVVIVAIAVISAGWLFFRFGLNTMSITYGITAGISVAVLYSETKSGRPGAFIGFGRDKVREAIFGACLGVFFLLLMGWVGHWLGVGMSITGAHALPILLFGVIIPFQEEILFRGTIAPTIAEKYGIALAIGASGLLFGLVHLLFGGTMWLFAVTTIFGIIMGWLTLRQQSIVPALTAHISYNFISFILFIIL